VVTGNTADTGVRRTSIVKIRLSRDEFPVECTRSQSIQQYCMLAHVLE